MDHFDHCHGLPASSHNLGSGMVTVGDLSDGWQQATHANLMAHAEATAVANKTPFFMPLMLSQIDGDSRTEFAPDQLLMGGKMLLNSSVTNFDLNLITQINNSAPTLTSLLKETINIRDRVLMPQYPSTPASLQKNNPVQNHSPPVQNKIIFSEIDDGSRMMFTPDQSMMNGHMLYSSNLTNLDLNLRMRYGSANNPAPTFTSLLEETIIMSNKDMMCQYPQMPTSLENIKPVQNYLPSAQNNIMFSQTDGCSRMAFAPDQSLMNGNMLLDLNLSNFDLNVRAQNELPNNSTPSLTSLLEERINIGNRDLTPQYPMTPANLEKNRPVNHSPPEFIDLVDDSRNDKSNWEGAWQSTTKRAKLCYLEPLATSPMAPAIPVPMGTPLPFKAALIEQQQTYIEEAVSSAEAIDQTVNAATQGLLENSGIDPNKTPQQKPKRKKHRPKVIREAKPARTPKPATPKSANPSGKRKYIRRNKAQVSVETPTSEPGNSNGKGVDSSQKRAYVQKNNDENSSHGSYSNATGTGVPVSRCGIKSVRRRLNFESDAPDSIYGYPGSMPSQAQNACCGRNIIKIDAGVSVHHSGVQQAVGNLIAGVPFDICSSTNQVPNEHMRFAEKNSISHFRPCRTDIMRTNQILDEFRSGKIQEHPAIHPQPSKRENLRRWERKRFPGITPNLDIDRYQEPDRVQQFISASEHIHDNNAQIMMDENLMQESDRIEKLDQSHIAYYNDAYLSQIYKKQGRDQGTYLSDIDGWKRHQVAMDTAEACTLDDVKNQLASEGMLEFDQPENITVNRSCLTLTPLSQTSVSSREEFNHTTKPGNHSGQVAMGQNKQSDPLQPFSSNYIQHNNNHEAITCLERQVSRTKSRKNKSQTFIHLTNTDQVGLKGQKASSHNLECFPHQKITEVTTLALQDFREVSNTTNLNSGVLVPYRDPLSLKTGVVVPYQDPLDDVMQKLRHLTVNESCHAETVEEQNAIISYSANGSMIPYEGPFDLTRKSRPRPKVDLDPETNRVWNLLMGNQGEGVNETDTDKEKWWEEERRVFRGRVDSFIARMHLVQGDRRFSKWKGSVVDSVVGVFLTQNVSDHLSSSAFMALAARFPMKSRCKSTESSAEERDLCIKNEDGNTTTLEDTSKWQEQTSDQELHGSTALVIVENEIANSNESFGSNSSFIVANYLKDKCVNSKEKVMGISQHSPDSQSSTPVTLTRSIYVAEVEDRWSVEDAGSSQNSSENPGQIGISSLSNITVEDLTIPTVCPGMDNFTSFTELLNSVLDVSDYTHSGFPERRNGSNSGNMKSSREHTSNNSEVIRQHNFAVISGSPPTVNLFKQTCKNFIRRQASPEAEPYPTKQFPSPSPLQPDLNEAPLPESVSQKFSLLSDGCTVKFQQEERVIRNKGTKQAVQSQLQKQSFDSQQNSPNLHNMNLLETSKIIKLHLEDNAYISRKLSAETPKRKRKEKMVKNENERNKTYDWDSLRKEVGLDGRKEERSHDTMDSVDWEAVRCAEVDEISHTIKERGMNNILAGRIKEFLNRLVRDHGSIDLEWIRKIEPGKAKDYLLSIQGLGLKSVECVRLLTLHHLSFPVDTNVGRICVRLGWVPLQPLPESVQLHLLELYPILDTIQKYLWPRLCKLDQQTLYELHYQLITFGKVFCTKSKPNCNACPMRGECKHFASAFASSRLKLTGPEEKNLVSSKVFAASEENHVPLLNPTQHIYQLEGTSNLTGSASDNCQPIIEEPASPEAECIQIEEREIEDAFYEDPDEIPTIKLNIEEFTQNLQNYMQSNNMEIQDVHMSKALVAINPEAASIPMPKLKNVSRLRTEHLVYELPDSHPLLEGFDPREPDDPSSYLLAIWTPGETAQSTETSKESCQFQDTGAFCNKVTCFSCNSRREAQAQIVRGTILIPCRTAMGGSFPLNGTYFQVNEVFADHDSSRNPIDVPREWIWNLSRRMVYFGTSVTSIFRGLNTEEIQFCFWRGFVCVRGFDRKTRAPRPLYARLHLPASKVPKNKQREKDRPAKRTPNNTRQKDNI